MSRLVSDHIREVARNFGLTPAEITAPGRATRPYLARQAVIARLHARGLSSVQIGRAVNRHHTTVLFALGRIKKPEVR